MVLNQFEGVSMTELSAELGRGNGPRRPMANTGDPYLSKLVAYIPTEMIAAYVTVSGFIKSLPPTLQNLWFWIVSLILLMITPFWIGYAARTRDGAFPVRHAAAATLAFGAWIFATGGPFNQFLYDPVKNPTGWYVPSLGSVILVLVCLCLPLIDMRMRPRQQNKKS